MGASGRKDSALIGTEYCEKLTEVEGKMLKYEEEFEQLVANMND